MAYLFILIMKSFEEYKAYILLNLSFFPIIVDSAFSIICKKS